MLDAMRNATKNWLGKIVLGLLFSLLILSFAVWGIGDIFRGFGSGTVAQAGDIEIPTEEYRAEYQTALQNLQRQLGRVVTNDQARKEGIDKLVLNRMISEELVNQKAKQFGLALNAKAIAQSVLDDPRFKTPAGTFDRVAFQRALSEFGLNEARFLAKQRSTYLRQQLGDSFAGDIKVPLAALAIWHRIGNETRSVEYLTLGAANAGEIPKPSDNDLQTFFEARKMVYRAPEYRKIVVLSATPASIAKPEAITDADARKLYEAVKATTYTTAEKRQVKQIIFKPGEETQAQEALAKIRSGTKFEDIARARKLNAEDTDLGTLAQQDFADPMIAKAAFTTNAGAVSEVVKSRFGPALVNVVKVEPASVKSFDSVKSELKKELAQKRAAEDVRKIYEKIEDQRTSGKVLEEAAKAAGLKVRVIDAIDATGKNKAGEEVKNLTEEQQLITAVFASDIGVDNETITTRSGGYVWFEVAGIEPARDRKLAEVRTGVETAWRNQEISKRLREKAEGYVKELATGKTFEEVARQAGVSAEAAPDVKRGTHAKLAPAVVNRIFSLPVGKAATATGTNLQRVVFRIVDSATPPLVDKSSDLERVEKSLENTYQQELFGQYIANLRKGLNVTYNPVALQNVVGGGQTN